MVARSNQPTEDESSLFDPDLDPDRFEGIHLVTVEEGRQLFDEVVRRELGISGEEFLRRWDSGEYCPVPDTAEGRTISGLVILLPFARPTSI